MSELSRRAFCQQGALALGALALTGGPLQAFLGRTSGARRGGRSYGALVPTLDRNTGLPLLLLPPGFTYVSFGWTGDPLSDGTLTPPRHDAMAVVRAPSGRIWLARNHEVRGSGAAFGSGVPTYDARGQGGTTHLVFNPSQGLLEDSWASLAGTSTNCAGGPTPWHSWLTCEETVEEFDATHGWVFEVPDTGAPTAQPLTGLGRFVHEAAAVDRRTSIVYETEDRQTAGFYRFVPNVPRELAQGGRLQMLAVTGQFQADLGGSVGVGSVFPVEWVDIDDPEQVHSPGTNDGLGVYTQGHDRGGATFRRLEGVWFGRRRVYFVSTTGGAAGRGQVWEYHPRREELRLLFESPDAATLDNPDNVTVSRRGGLVLCEDGGGSDQRLMGLARTGEILPIAQNNVVLAGEKNGIVGDFRASEWAGATFHRQWLFANIQTPGITFAITGPWRTGGL
jgi:hypothetical protein